MKNDSHIRLKADRLLVQHICFITRMSASSLAIGAGMAPTTLNRLVSNKVTATSTLKDSTIEKIAERWGLNHLGLLARRKKIAEYLRAGKTDADILESINNAPAASSFKISEPSSSSFNGPERDPLMDKIMGATYDVWFHSAQRKKVVYDDLPELVRLLYSRLKPESKSPTSDEIRKRAADMLAVMAMEAERKK